MAQTPDRALRVAIAAGGTGGHIMPGLALGEALENIGHPVEVEYICGSRPVERRIYAEAGIQPRVFPVSSMSTATLWQRVRRDAGLGLSFLRSLLMMRRFNVLVGMGGYIAAPAATAAAIWRIPIVLHDSNSVLGRVNRILAPKAAVIASGLPLVNFPEGVDPAKIAEVGTPVRLSIPRGDREEAARETYLRTDAFTLFIYGGSLGAVGLNDLMAETVGHICAQWPEDAPPFQVIWEAGPDNLTQVRNALEDKHLKGQFWIAPSIERMDHAYALADLVIGRAGGSFLAELLLCGLPSILFPLPTAADQHQHHNAAVLKRRRAAIVREQDETDPRQLADEILTLVREPQRLAALAEVAEDLACPSAARDLARLVVETATGESAV